MKFFKKTLIVVLLAVSMAFVSACGKKTDPDPQAPVITEQSYTFQQGNVVYERSEQFTLGGTSIRVVMSDGTVKTIILNDSMIKSMPDMTTVGQKTAVITYMGKDYTITFNVVENELDQYSQVIYQFLAKFNSNDVNVSSMSGSASLNLLYSFLQDEATVNETAEFDVTQAQILEAINSLNVEGVEDIYDILLSSLVRSSLTVQNPEAADFETLTAQYGIQALASLFGEYVAGANYKKLVIDNVLKEYRPNIEDTLRAFLEQQFIMSQTSYDQMTYKLMDGIYYPYVYGAEIDLQETIDELIEVVENDTVMSDLDKDIFVSALQSLRNGEANHIVSNIFTALGSEETSYNYYATYQWQDYSGTWHTEYYITNLDPENETVEQRATKVLYYNTFINTIYAVESLYGTTDIIATLQQIVDGLNVMNDLEHQIRQEWNLAYLGDPDSIPALFSAIPALQALIYTLEGDMVTLNDEMQISNILAYQFSEILTDMTYNDVDYPVSYEEVRDMVETYLETQFALLIEQGTFDIYEFLDGLKEILFTLDDSSLIQNFETLGTPKLLTFLLNSYVDFQLKSYQDQMSENDFAEFEQSMLDDRDIMMPVLEALDMMLTFNNGNVHFNATQLANLEVALHNLAGYFDQNDPLVVMAGILTDSSIEEFTDRLIEILDTYKIEFAQTLTVQIGGGFDMPYSEQLEDEIYEWSLGFINEVIYGTVNIETSFTDILTIIDQNANPDKKAVLYATIALIAFNMDDVDYNQLFSQIQLPEQIESIDFNTLVAKLKTAQTYDIFDLSSVQVRSTTNAQGMIVSETLTLTLNVEFDILISQIIGEFTLELVINY